MDSAPATRLDSAHAERGRTLELAAVASAALAGEIVIATLVFGSIWNPGAGLAAHLAVVALLGLWTWRLAQAGRDLRFAILLGSTTAVLGPVGAAGTLTTIVLTVLHALRTTPFQDWYAALFPERESRTVELVAEIRALSSDEEGSVAPFVDLLYFGSLAQRQELIGLLAKDFRPQLAPVLRLALQDKNNAVRVQAASTIASIEDGFLDRSLALAKAIEQRPKDADLRLALARLHDDYAVAGILDADREEQSRAQALAAYRAYLEARPGDLGARAAVGRLLLRRRDNAEACRWLEASIREGFSSDDIVLLYMEGLFNSGRLDELRRVAASHHEALRRNAELPIEARDAASLWGGPPAALGEEGAG